MLPGTLYDIGNHNDFFDSITIMETMEDNSFDLIFMELPRLLSSTKQIYDTPKYKRGQNIKASFLCQCLENAHRLLKEEGFLILFVPNTTYTNQNYTLVLNQFFPSISHLTHLVPQELENTIFICSKQNNFLFRKSITRYPIDYYPYRDHNGLYRLISPFTDDRNAGKHLDKHYIWRNFVPSWGERWLYPEEKLDSLFRTGKIVIEDNNIFVKRYRHNELIRVPVTLEHPIINGEDWRSCDSDTLNCLFTMYCKPHNSVFCPFDYGNFFPTVASKHSLYWTSVRMHEEPAIPEIRFLPLETTIINQLPSTNSFITYRTDIIMDGNALNELKQQVSTLTTSIQTVKKVLNLQENGDNIIDTELSEDILAEKLHAYITASITPQMLDMVRQDAPKQFACWDLMEKSSQKFILTALLFKKQIDASTEIDYSAVSLELCKAFETELYAKLFRPYAELIKSQNINLRSQYPGMHQRRLTKDFYAYLYNYVKGKELSPTIGCMREILEKTLSKKEPVSIFEDFRTYLHQVLKNDFFRKNYTIGLPKIAQLRNCAVHKGDITSDDTTICIVLIKEKLFQLLTNYKESDKTDK